MTPPDHFFRGIYALTDRNLSGPDHPNTVKKLLQLGVRWIQFREKHDDRGTIFRTALDLRRITAERGARLIVNDHLDIAMAVDADGVHLGQDDLPLEAARRIAPAGFIIGISTHNVLQARQAVQSGADYIGFGPLFPTETKDAGVPRGIDGLRQVRDQVSVPIAAIGGISAETAPAVVAAGADLLAVASALYVSGDWEAAVRRLEAAWK